MQKKNLIRFLESFILLPVVTVMPFGNLQNVSKTNPAVTTPQIVLLQKQNIEVDELSAFNQAGVQKAEILGAQAKAIDVYFKARNMRLEGMGMKMAEEADKNGLDWRLIPALSVQETTGGEHACPKTYERTGDIGYTFNVFGWGSCKIKFKSYEDAIETIARNLGGNNQKTKHYYFGKTTEEKLRKYNPVSVAPRYVPQVLAIMDIIGDKAITAPAKALAVNI